MNSQKGSVAVVVIILLVIAAGGGYFYFKIKNAAQSSLDQEVVETEVRGTDQQSAEQSPVVAASATTPRDIFLERNTSMNSAQTLDEMLMVSKQYDTQDQIAKIEKALNGASQENRDKFYSFARAFLTPTTELLNVQETITDDTAIVTAGTSSAAQIETEFIKEGGVWKVVKSKTINQSDQ